MNTKNDTPRVWVGCLAAYNAGSLHGEWCDATTEDEIQAAIARVLATSPARFAEEIAFFDNEGFGGLIGEYDAPATIAAWGSLIEDHGLDIVAGVAGHIGKSEPPRLVRHIIENESVGGVHESRADFAEEYWHDSGLEIPEQVEPWIDWDRAARDLQHEIFEVRAADGLHFFSRHWEDPGED